MVGVIEGLLAGSHRVALTDDAAGRRAPVADNAIGGDGTPTREWLKRLISATALACSTTMGALAAILKIEFLKWRRRLDGAQWY